MQPYCLWSLSGKPQWFRAVSLLRESLDASKFSSPTIPDTTAQSFTSLHLFWDFTDLNPGQGMERADKRTGPLLQPNTYTTSITAKAVNLLLFLACWILSSTAGNDTDCQCNLLGTTQKGHLCGCTVTYRGVSALYVVCELLFLQLFPKALHRGWQNRALIYLN